MSTNLRVKISDLYNDTIQDKLKTYHPDKWKSSFVFRFLNQLLWITSGWRYNRGIVVSKDGILMVLADNGRYYYRDSNYFGQPLNRPVTFIEERGKEKWWKTTGWAYSIKLIKL